MSRYNRRITDALERSALDAYGEIFATTDAAARAHIVIVDAAGSFELIALAARLARDSFRGIVALGCIIKGETLHDEVLAHAVTGGLAQIAARRAIPIGLGVLTVNSIAQAEARAGLGASPLGNKGAEAMQAVLHAIAQMDRLNEIESMHLHSPVSPRAPEEHNHPALTAPAREFSFTDKSSPARRVTP